MLTATHSISKYALCNDLSTYDFDSLRSSVWVALDALEHIHFKAFAYMVKGHRIPFKSISSLRFFCFQHSIRKVQPQKWLFDGKKWQWMYRIWDDDVDKKSPIEIKERFMSSIEKSIISRDAKKLCGSSGDRYMFCKHIQVDGERGKRKNENSEWSIALADAATKNVNIGRTTVLTIFITVIKENVHRKIQVFDGFCVFVMCRWRNDRPPNKQTK